MRPCRWSDGTTFDFGLERNRRVEQLTGRAPAVFGQPAVQESREHRRSVVAAAKLAHLPLLRQHLERVAHFGLQRAFERLAARTSLETVPGRDRRDLPPDQ
jgi:hypothetical protein